MVLTASSTGWAGLIVHSLASRLTLRKFCEMKLKSDTGKYLLVPSVQDIALNVDDVFVPLLLNNQGSGQALYTHVNLFSAGSRIKIVGDPGSGKSSLVKRLYRDTCKEGVESPSKAMLPILFELRHLVVPLEVEESNLGLWLFNLLRDDVVASAIYRMDECFDIYSKTSGILFLLDGLDEVPSNSYVRVRSAINGLHRVLANLGTENVIVLTMRAQFHAQFRNDYGESFPVTLSLKPFSPSDIFDFLTRWPFNSNREENISRLFESS